MAKIEVSGIDIYYKLCSDCNEYDGDIYWTEFFTLEGEKPLMKWSWKKFRKVDSGKSVPNFVKRFELQFWITESEHLTKSELKNLLERKVELINRKKELERGEII